MAGSVNLLRSDSRGPGPYGLMRTPRSSWRCSRFVVEPRAAREVKAGGVHAMRGRDRGVKREMIFVWPSLSINR